MSKKGSGTDSLVHENEALRVNDLQQYDILNSPSEETFRSLCETTAMIFDTAVGMLSFVDSDKVFFKEYTGGNLAGTTLKRDHSLCSMVVLKDCPTVFNNLDEDPCRYVNPVFINSIGLKFYAGAPITTSAGYRIGALAVADFAPREFSEREKVILQTLARLVMDELELRQYILSHLSTLHTTIKDQASELTFIRHELDQSHLELDNFLYRASHDLKGPLSTMAGLLHLAQQEVSDHQARSYMEKLALVSTNMNGALNKLVVIYTLLRAREGEPLQKLWFKKPTIITLLNSVMITQKREIDRKNIKLVYKIEPLHWYTNEKYVQLILANLVENAVHFQKSATDKEKLIKISIHQNSKHVILKVYDTGEGIPDEYIGRIFDLFFRGSSSARSGMGLYIVKKLVEKLEGHIEVKSVFNNFTEFTVTFPT